VEVTGPKEDVITLAQILAWIGAAFQISNTEEVQYSAPVITQLANNILSMNFSQTTLVDAERTCWLLMFYNPVIARGFPIPHRINHELGLEMPLEMMAALNGAEQAVEYSSGLLIKGFSSMLVPVKRQQDSVQWHLVNNIDGKRIKYSDVRARCPKRLSVDEFSQDALRKTRAFLAWWKISESYVGTSRIRYEDVKYSKARRTSKKINMTDISVSFRNWGILSINFAMGQKDCPRHVPRAGRLEMMLNAAEEMNVYLYDFACKRAWLICGTELLLHLVLLKHRKKPYIVQGREVTLVVADPAYNGSASCRKALMNMASVPIFSDAAVSNKDFCVNDLLQQLWQRLEILEGQDKENGIGMKMKLGERLKGHEIMDLVMDKGILKQRETAIKDTSGGWLDLIKASDGIVLFGSHFGELIKPASETNKLCLPWMSLPESKDYLATTARKLLQIFGESD